jgi:hypothetical protein
VRFFWALGGILSGALAAVVAGVVLDYAQRLGWIVQIGEQWLLLPIVSGLAGLLGGIVSVSMFARYLRESERPASSAPATRPGKVAAPKGMEHVPGMPTFDVDALRRGQHQSGGNPTGAPPTQKESS